MFDSEFEQSLFELRKTKLEEIVKLGQAAYPNHFPASHIIPAVRAEWGEATAEALEAPRVTVAVAGRIMAIRAQGKAGFATLQQGGQRLQIYVRLDVAAQRAHGLLRRLRLRYGAVKGHGDSFQHTVQTGEQVYFPLGLRPFIGRNYRVRFGV